MLSASMRESSSLLSHDATCMLVMEDPTKRVGQIVAGVKMLATSAYLVGN